MGMRKTFKNGGKRYAETGRGQKNLDIIEGWAQILATQKMSRWEGVRSNKKGEMGQTTHETWRARENNTTKQGDISRGLTIGEN